jgi:cytochrome c-type biogenesis protein CcmH/NrfG
LGAIELQTGRWARTVASFRASIHENSAQPVVLVLLGDALLDLQRPAEAIVSYDDSLRLQPDHPAAHFCR